jgi:hypothetical protein
MFRVNQLLSTVSTLLQKNSLHLTTNGIHNALSHTRLTIRDDSPMHPLSDKVTTITAFIMLRYTSIMFTNNPINLSTDIM